MYATVCHSTLLKHLILTYLRLVWINFGVIRIVNIYRKLTYPGPEVDKKYYVITMIPNYILVYCGRHRGLA